MTISIVRYAAFCERLPGLNIMNFLNQHYFALLHSVISNNEGTIGPMIGDTQIAYWSLSGKKTSTDRACRAAARLLVTLALDQQGLPSEQRFEATVGIATGQVLRVGQQILGNTVNLSSRLCTLSKSYLAPVLVDSETARQSSAATFRSLDRVLIEGKGPLEIYELVDAS